MGCLEDCKIGILEESRVLGYYWELFWEDSSVGNIRK